MVLRSSPTVCPPITRGTGLPGVVSVAGWLQIGQQSSRHPSLKPSTPSRLAVRTIVRWYSESRRSCVTVRSFCEREQVDEHVIVHVGRLRAGKHHETHSNINACYCCSWRSCRVGGTKVSDRKWTSKSVAAHLPESWLPSGVHGPRDPQPAQRRPRPGGWAILVPPDSLVLLAGCS